MLKATSGADKIADAATPEISDIEWPTTPV